MQRSREGAFPDPAGKNRLLFSSLLVMFVMGLLGSLHSQLLCQFVEGNIILLPGDCPAFQEQVQGLFLVEVELDQLL